MAVASVAYGRIVVRASPSSAGIAPDRDARVRQMTLAASCWFRRIFSR